MFNHDSARESGHAVCSMLELKRWNAELKKQNEDKDHELELLKNELHNVHSSEKITAAYQKIRVQEERYMNVRGYSYRHYCYYKNRTRTTSIKTC